MSVVCRWTVRRTTTTSGGGGPALPLRWSPQRRGRRPPVAAGAKRSSTISSRVLTDMRSTRCANGRLRRASARSCVTVSSGNSSSSSNTEAVYTARLAAAPGWPAGRQRWTAPFAHNVPSHNESTRAGLPVPARLPTDTLSTVNTHEQYSRHGQWRTHNRISPFALTI